MTRRTPPGPPLAVPTAATSAATAELGLRLPTADDVPRLTEICQDPDIQRYTRVPSPYTHEHARAFVAFAAAGVAEATGLHLVVVDAPTDRVLGAVGLGIDRRDASGEIGYWVAPEARRRGVAVTGCRALLTHAFEVLGLGYVALWAAAANDASNAVARRLGCTHEGTARRAMLLGPTGDWSAPRGDANLWGIRPGELR